MSSSDTGKDRRQLQETTRDKMLAKGKKRARGQNCPAIEEGDLVEVRKRSKRFPLHVQLLETVSGPLTPPTKEERSSRTLEVQEPELAETAAETAETAFSCLDGLPWQLKLQILQHLPVVDLCRLSQVNTGYHALCSCDLLWALHCYRAAFCRAAAEESWKWNFMAATIGIVHAKLLDDSDLSKVLQIQGDAYVIDPMHAFFTSEAHRWRWSHEFMPIMDALHNADVIVTYRGLQCGVVQTRFGEGAYQVSRRRKTIGTVFSSSGFLAIIPRRLMELLREENGTGNEMQSGTTSGTTRATKSGLRIGTQDGSSDGSADGTGTATDATTGGSTDRRVGKIVEGMENGTMDGTDCWRWNGKGTGTEAGSGGVLVRNLDGTLFTSRTGDFFVSAVRTERGMVEEDVVGLDVPVDLMVTTGGDWSVDDDDEDEEVDEDDLRFLESVMCAEKAPSATLTSDSRSDMSSVDDGAESSQDWSFSGQGQRGQ